MFVSPHSHTAQALVHTSNTHVRFGLEGMEEYYSAFKEKLIIHTEAQFDAEYFNTACPDIYYQIGMHDWGPFTIPIDLYFPKLVWEFYASYRERLQLLKHKGRTEAFPCLTSAACPLFQPLDRTVHANSVITLATKTDKEAPVMK
ncbi:hypothetical protein HAX54_020948 [Datura stramonium]|uniref:Uncharacterized protein n=1 Tax=Datura stramonium TaxID=4076 RepID=A0ABS8UT18_DATST|nr:hypothetical protein [Datura stramonium]